MERAIHVVRPDRRPYLEILDRLFALINRTASDSPRGKEHFLLLWHFDRLGLFHRFRPRMKRAQDGLLPMLCLPRL